MMYVKNPESGGRNCEEIYGNHVRHVIFQERPPRLGWRLGKHLIRCLAYIDLKMVRAGVVQHPGE